MKRPIFTAVMVLVLLLAGCQPKPRSVSLALLGDVMIARSTDPKPGSLAILAPYLSSSDLVLANLESPLTADPPLPDSSYNLCTPASRANLLASWGFDLLSVANNHQDDCGPQGPTDTRSALQAVGITPIGPGMDPVQRKINGLLLAFLAFDDVSSRLDENSALQAIRLERARGALVIVSVHWGMEYQGGASDRQKNLAAEFANAGAALIWGHHPHVLQPAEWIGPSHGRALALYSLGNALFDQDGLSETRQSALVLVSLAAQGVTGVSAVPFEIEGTGSQLVQPDPAISELILDQLRLPRGP